MSKLSGVLLALDCLSKRGTFPYRKSEDFFLSKDKPRIFTIFIAFKPTPLGFLTHQRSCIWFSCFSTFTRKTPVKPWQPSMRFTRPKFARASLFSASDFWFISRTFKSLPRSGKTLAQNLDNIGSSWRQNEETEASSPYLSRPITAKPATAKALALSPSVRIKVQSFSLLFATVFWHFPTISRSGDFCWSYNCFI